MEQRDQMDKVVLVVLVELIDHVVVVVVVAIMVVAELVVEFILLLDQKEVRDIRIPVVLLVAHQPVYQEQEMGKLLSQLIATLHFLIHLKQIFHVLVGQMAQPLFLHLAKPCLIPIVGHLVEVQQQQPQV